MRPAEHAASTYTKPELPDEAKENTERGVKQCARHYLALMVYALTRDTSLADMSSPTSGFAKPAIVGDINTNTNTMEIRDGIQYHLCALSSSRDRGDAPEGSIVVKYRVESYDRNQMYQDESTHCGFKYKSGR